MSADLALPALQQTLLDAPTLAALFRDLAACASVQSVTTRDARLGRGAPPVAIALDQALHGLRTGDVRSVQVRYRHAGQTWCDTLMAAAGGTRLVRICEDDIVASVEKTG